MNEPGKYRNEPVSVGDRDHGGVYTPPKCLPDIERLMAHCCEWLNNPAMLEGDQRIRAALAHYYLGLIHPFGDGNGRTVRLVEALVLKTAGFRYVPEMLSNYYYQHVDDYYWAFSEARKGKGDVTPFIKFVLEAYVSSLEEIKNRVMAFIRFIILRESYRALRADKIITQRQHDLLILLTTIVGPLKPGDLHRDPRFLTLYRKVSDRTAKRDLIRLTEMDLLIKDEEGRYKLNIFTLD